MDSYRPHVLLKGTEWLQQSVSVENLHGNKSYNLSSVCTLDWLRAITLTKKAFFPPSYSSFSLPSSILSALCQINPLNFPKDLRLFPFFCLRVQPALSFLDVARRRGDCLPNETAVKNSQCLHVLSPSLFYLTPLISQSPSQRERELRKGHGNLLSVGSSQVLSDGGMGGWGSSRGRGRRGEEE